MIWWRYIATRCFNGRVESVLSVDLVSANVLLKWLPRLVGLGIHVQHLTTTITHTHAHLMPALCPGLPGWAGTRKVKPIWILLKQETVSGNGISWAICKSASHSRQKTMPVLHHSSFLQAACPSCRPTNSVKALKAKKPGEPIPER